MRFLEDKRLMDLFGSSFQIVSISQVVRTRNHIYLIVTLVNLNFDEFTLFVIPNFIFVLESD